MKISLADPFRSVVSRRLTRGSGCKPAAWTFSIRPLRRRGTFVLLLAGLVVGCGGEQQSRRSVVPPRQAWLTPPIIGGSPVYVRAGYGRAVDRLAASRGLWRRHPDRYTYHWFRCDQALHHCIPIPGATSDRYVLAMTDVGDAITVRVTAHYARASASAYSRATKPVTSRATRAFYIAPWGSDSYAGTKEKGIELARRVDFSRRVVRRRR